MVQQVFSENSSQKRSPYTKEILEFQCIFYLGQDSFEVHYYFKKLETIYYWNKLQNSILLFHTKIVIHIALCGLNMKFVTISPNYKLIFDELLLFR